MLGTYWVCPILVLSVNMYPQAAWMLRLIAVLMLQEENFSEALSNASKVWAPPGISELPPSICMLLICSVN